MARLIGLIVVGLFVGAAWPVPAADAGTLRVGVLKYGTVSWELDVIKHHRLDRAEGVDIEVVALAGTQATKVALQGGSVDVIVTDWLWVSRQRAAGADYTFTPYSTAVGALMVPGESPIRGLADLEGRRLGIAGGPLDKSWLVLRALARRHDGADLDAVVEKVFGAPPLLNEQMLSRRIDAVVTFWPFAARLEAAGMRRLIGVDEAMRKLGLEAKVPIIGYVFSAALGAAREAEVRASCARRGRRGRSSGTPTPSGSASRRSRGPGTRRPCARCVTATAPASRAPGARPSAPRRGACSPSSARSAAPTSSAPRPSCNPAPSGRHSSSELQP